MCSEMPTEADQIVIMRSVHFVLERVIFVACFEKKVSSLIAIG